MRRTETLDVRIPAGVSTGSRVRVAGHGNAGTHGAPPGDLYIVFDVQPHAYFERRGDDIYTRVPITVSEAALGAKIEVPTIDGRAVLASPARLFEWTATSDSAKKGSHLPASPASAAISMLSCK